MLILFVIIVAVVRCSYRQIVALLRVNALPLSAANLPADLACRSLLGTGATRFFGEIQREAMKTSSLSFVGNICSLAPSCLILLERIDMGSHAANGPKRSDNSIAPWLDSRTSSIDSAAAVSFHE